MWMLFGRPVRRWVALSVALPLITAVLSFIGRKIQQRKGSPTKTSKALLGTSNLLNRRQRKGKNSEHSTDTSGR